MYLILANCRKGCLIEGKIFREQIGIQLVNPNLQQMKKNRESQNIGLKYPLVKLFVICKLTHYVSRNIVHIHV